MKKHLTPYLLILILILVLSGGTYYVTKKYSVKTGAVDGAAALFNTGPTIAPGLFFVDHNNGDGSCWRGTYQDDGTPVGLYHGSWASGTDECVLLIGARNNNLNSLRISSTAGTTTIAAKTGEGYFNNATSIQFLQLKLVKSGVLTLSKVTGTFNPETFAAIKAFQTKNKLPATGYPDTATVKLLNAVSFTTSKATRTTTSQTRTR